MSGPQFDPSVFGPCSGLTPDPRDNTCTNNAAEYVDYPCTVTGLVDADGVFSPATVSARLCTSCADAAPGVIARRPLTARPGGHQVEQAAAPRPANVAYVDAEMADAAATLDEMVESYRRGSVEFNVDPAARYLLMSRASVDTYDHFEVAKLLAVAVARLGDQPTPAVTA